MPEVTQYSPGMPCWPGLRSPSTDVSAEFYSQLFGWQAGPPAANGYVIFSLGGKPVAGLGPLMSDSHQPGWCTYVAVDDADTVVEAATRAGGDVRTAPLDVFGGRVAVVVDPTCAELWLWQPAGFNGAQLVDERGAMCWNELGARDVEAARAFYRAVFGWSTSSMSSRDSDRLAWILDGKAVGSLVQIDDRQLDQRPEHWLVSFGAVDLDATKAKAVKLGAELYGVQASTSIGRSEALLDPNGTLFSMVALSEIPRLSGPSSVRSSDAAVYRGSTRA